MLDNLHKVMQVLWARLCLRRCTSVGKLTRLHGKVIVENQGKMYLGERVKLRGVHVPIELATMSSGKLTIGNNVAINSGASICAQDSVVIGNNCGIGNYSLIMDTDFHQVGDFNKMSEPSPICIEDDVWLAAHVIVLKGVTIGKGAVVSAGSVVVTDIPPYTLVGGVPARIINRIPAPGSEEKGNANHD
jgi:acetyltransferase-like isoleucine patch superfamily enzyme